MSSFSRLNVSSTLPDESIITNKSIKQPGTWGVEGSTGKSVVGVICTVLGVGVRLTDEVEAVTFGEVVVTTVVSSLTIFVVVLFLFKVFAGFLVIASVVVSSSAVTFVVAFTAFFVVATSSEICDAAFKVLGIFVAATVTFFCVVFVSKVVTLSVVEGVVVGIFLVVLVASPFTVDFIFVEAFVVVATVFGL